MKGILKVFAVACALAVFGLTLMLAGFATGGASAVRQAMDYTNLTQRYYRGDLPFWLERALGWTDDLDHFEDRVDNWADDFSDSMDRWADDFEDDMDHFADSVENWAEGYHHAGWRGW